jgi:hypothetical protein
LRSGFARPIGGILPYRFFPFERPVNHFGQSQAATSGYGLSQLFFAKPKCGVGGFIAT